MISVVLPTHRGHATLARAMRSILEQTLREFELLVIPNGPDRSLVEQARTVAAGDPRVRVIHEARPGAESARNRGMAEARFAWIALQDDDDVSHPERLAELAAEVTREPRSVLVGSWAIVFDDETGLRPPFHHAIRDSIIRLQLRSGPCPFVATTTMFRREDALAAGGFLERYPHCEDYCLWARLADRGRLANVPRHLAAYRHQDPSRRPEYAARQRKGHAELQAHYFRPLSRFEDWRVRLAMRPLARRARDRVEIDWPPELRARFGLPAG